MQDLEFKRHLRDLVHGHHHPEEHDWESGGAGPVKATSKRTAEKPKRATKRPKGSRKKR